MNTNSLVNPFIKYKYRKKKIPTAVRNQLWILKFGETFRVKCPTKWCQNTITPFSFEAGHDIPESHGGPTTLENLIPICGSCNKSMGNMYTFQEWSERYTNIIDKNINVINTIDIKKKKPFWMYLLCIL